MNILALDLGTETGWALSRDGAVTAGTWVLGTKKENSCAKKLRMDRRCDPRFLRLLGHLRSVPRPLDYVVFEDVLFGKSTQQCNLWATWRAATWAMSMEGIQVDCLNTATLKKFATGNGGADKSQMSRALTLDPRYILHPKGVRDLKTGDILGDDAVDALHLLNWAMKTFDNPPKVGNVL